MGCCSKSEQHELLLDEHCWSKSVLHLHAHMLEPSDQMTEIQVVIAMH